MLEDPTMTTVAQKLVERFYFEVWNQANEHVAREILHREFRFRGSLARNDADPTGSSTTCVRSM